MDNNQNAQFTTMLYNNRQLIIKTIEGKNPFVGKQREYSSIIRQLEPKITKQPTMESRQAEIALGKELEQLGLTGKTLNLATTDYINYTPVKFGECIATAERIIAAEKYREEQAARQAASAAERAEIQAAQKARRDQETAEFARQLEAEKKRIAQYRIDGKLPIFSERELENVARESLTKKAEAEARGATVSG